MKGGGLTWLGWLMIGTGGVLMYAGMTGQSVVAEISAALNGSKAQPAGPTGHAAPPAKGSANSIEHDIAAQRGVPYPVLGAHLIGTKPGEK